MAWEIALRCGKNVLWVDRHAPEGTAWAIGGTVDGAAVGGDPPEWIDPCLGTFATAKEALGTVRTAWESPAWRLRLLGDDEL